MFVLFLLHVKDMCLFYRSAVFVAILFWQVLIALSFHFISFIYSQGRSITERSGYTSYRKSGNTANQNYMRTMAV